MTFWHLLYDPISDLILLFLLIIRTSPCNTKLSLLSVSGRVKEEVDGFFNTYTVCCKAGCYSILKKTSQIAKETVKLMVDIEKRIGSFFESQQTVHACPPSHKEVCYSPIRTPSHRSRGYHQRQLLLDTPTWRVLSQPVASSTGSPVDN